MRIHHFMLAMAVLCVGQFAFAVKKPSHRKRQAVEFGGSKVEVLLAPPSEFPLAVRVAETSIQPAEQLLRTRLMATQTHPTVADPIVLDMKGRSVSQILRALANRRFASRKNSFSDSNVLQVVEQLSHRTKNQRLALEARDLEWLDLKKLSKTLERKTIIPSLTKDDMESLFEDSSLYGALNEHTHGRADVIRANLSRWNQENPSAETVPFDVFLPRHLSSQLHAYAPFRGRNCFATALSFADSSVVENPGINIVRESNHAVGMINSDEFSHGLWLGYYELRDQEILSGLHYADIIVFYDASVGTAYNAYRHAAVHLGGDVYLHKQSKSAASPIEFVTWQSIVETWTPLVNKLDYKVFRKLPLANQAYKTQTTALESIRWTH